MKILLLLLLSFCVSMVEAETPRRNVVDYFLLLPKDYFEGTPQGWLDFLRQPKCGVVDLANGYINCTGDGAQPPFEVALFHYRDGRPLLAVCQGELEGSKSLYLGFFELSSNGKMKKTRRSIFPMADAGNDKGDWQFQLPRQGKSILVRKQGGKILRKFAWNGEGFQEEK